MAFLNFYSYCMSAEVMLSFPSALRVIRVPVNIALLFLQGITFNLVAVNAHQFLSGGADH